MGAEDGEEERSKFVFGNLYLEGLYVPKHPELFQASPRWETWLHPDFLHAHADAGRAIAEHPVGNSELTDAVTKAWDTLLTLECLGGGAGVYSFNAFTLDFCKMLVEEVDHAQANYDTLLQRPNGMNRYGLVLNQLGLEPAITALQQVYLEPLQRFLYGQEGSDPDDHHCFIVRYKHDEDVGLDMHQDSSDVTVNVCLGREFTGSTLSFCGLAGRRGHRLLQHVYQHRVGRAVIHLGRQRHGADNLVAGERLNFILWSNSSAWRQSDGYFRTRSRRKEEGEPPDLVCLSYTHDEDYTAFKESLPDHDALQRGVMLDRVQSNPENKKYGGC